MNTNLFDTQSTTSNTDALHHHRNKDSDVSRLHHSLFVHQVIQCVSAVAAAEKKKLYVDYSRINQSANIHIPS